MGLDWNDPQGILREVSAMKNKTKHVLDFIMSVMLLFLMAYQVTGEKAHEWLGIAMFVVVVAHNLLNLKWYSVLFKGRYPFLRIIRTAVNVLLFGAMLGTMVSGILLNSYIFPLSIHGTMAVARVLHLAGSYWCFVLMGIHLGLHWSIVVSILSGKKTAQSGVKTTVIILLRIVALAVAAYGGYCFICTDIFTYMTFQTHFVFLDYERTPALVLGDQLAMMGTWVFLSYYFIKIAQCFSRLGKRGKVQRGE